VTNSILNEVMCRSPGKMYGAVHARTGDGAVHLIYFL
jgi:hypothetical protein